MARKRKAGDGTVRQRKDERWEGRIVIGYDDNGYPKTKNVLAKTKKECIEKLQKLKEECGGLKPEKVRSEMPFGVWLTYWYENHSGFSPPHSSLSFWSFSTHSFLVLARTFFVLG